MSSLLQLRNSVRRYINEPDVTNTHFDDTELDDYLNQATQFLSMQMEWPFQISNSVAVQDQALYQLPSDFIELLDVYFDQTRLITLSREDLGALNPSWQKDPSSIPRIAYRVSANIVGLYPPPDATQAGKTLQITYIQLPATLVSDADVPDLHSSFQMCLPFYAAFICEMILGNDKKSSLQLQNYDNHRKALMSKVQKFSDDLMRFRWGWNYPERNS